MSPLLLVSGLAFGMVPWWGRRGFVFFDYSFFIDIAYRLLHGQRMYTDIGGVAHGPLTYYVQALFFHCFGVSVWSCLLHAATVHMKPHENFWIFPSGVFTYAATDRISTAPLVT